MRLDLQRWFNDSIVLSMIIYVIVHLVQEYSKYKSETNTRLAIDPNMSTFD